MFGNRVREGDPTGFCHFPAHPIQLPRSFASHCSGQLSVTAEEHETALAESMDDSVVTREERAALEATRERGLAPNQFLAPYFSEEVRLFLNNPPAPHEVGIQGSELYADGLTIHTTVDLRLQRAAEEVLCEALDNFDADKLEYLTKHKREREFVHSWRV